LGKMQIVELNEKDAIDTMMLLREHEVGSSDGETINAGYIASLTACDWGLWRTLTMNLERVRRVAQNAEKLSPEDKVDIDSKIKKLRARIDEEPKSRGWRVRAQIGDKKKWYRDIEEVSRE
jgi:HAMP domain-containing protein